LLVNYGKTVFSETYPELWLFLMGGLFITVVMFFPNGLAGIYEKYAKRFKFLGKFSDSQPAKKADVMPANDIKGMGVKA
jgi:urea transport system permease protein